MERRLRSPRFWRRLSLTAMISPLNESRLDYAFGNQSHRFSPAFLAFDLVTQLFSPYEFNPLNLNPVKDLLEASIDFEALRESEHPIKLFLSATHVRTGRSRCSSATR
jgi:NTE family protein